MIVSISGNQGVYVHAGPFGSQHALPSICCEQLLHSLWGVVGASQALCGTLWWSRKASLPLLLFLFALPDLKSVLVVLRLELAKDDFVHSVLCCGALCLLLCCAALDLLGMTAMTPAALFLSLVARNVPSTLHNSDSLQV